MQLRYSSPAEVTRSSEIPSPRFCRSGGVAQKIAVLLSASRTQTSAPLTKSSDGVRRAILVKAGSLLSPVLLFNLLLAKAWIASGLSTCISSDGRGLVRADIARTWRDFLCSATFSRRGARSRAGRLISDSNIHKLKLSFKDCQGQQSGHWWTAQVVAKPDVRGLPLRAVLNIVLALTPSVCARLASPDGASAKPAMITSSKKLQIPLTTSSAVQKSCFAVDTVQALGSPQLAYDGSPDETHHFPGRFIPFSSAACVHTQVALEICRKPISKE